MDRKLIFFIDSLGNMMKQIKHHLYFSFENNMHLKKDNLKALHITPVTFIHIFSTKLYKAARK